MTGFHIIQIIIGKELIEYIYISPYSTNVPHEVLCFEHLLHDGAGTSLRVNPIRISRGFVTCVLEETFQLTLSLCSSRKLEEI